MVIGAIIGIVSFHFFAVIFEDRNGYGFSFSSREGGSMGFFFGGICGLLVLWPTRNIGFMQCLACLGGAALIGGCFLGLFLGPFGGMVGGIGGFWLGVMALVARRPF